MATYAYIYYIHMHYVPLASYSHNIYTCIILIPTYTLSSMHILEVLYIRLATLPQSDQPKNAIKLRMPLNQNPFYGTFIYTISLSINKVTFA